VIDLANKVGIGLFVSEDDAWNMALKLFNLGIK